MALSCAASCAFSSSLGPNSCAEAGASGASDKAETRSSVTDHVQASNAKKGAAGPRPFSQAIWPN